MAIPEMQDLQRTMRTPTSRDNPIVSQGMSPQGVSALPMQRLPAIPPQGLPAISQGLQGAPPPNQPPIQAPIPQFVPDEVMTMDRKSRST